EVIETDIPLATEQVTFGPQDLDLSLPGDERFEKWRLMHKPEFEFTFGPEYNEQTCELEATVRENPTTRKFEFIGSDGFKYGRSYAMVNASVDGEGLYTHEIAVDAEGDFFATPFREAVRAEAVVLYHVDEQKLRAILADKPELMHDV